MRRDELFNKLPGIVRRKTPNGVELIIPCARFRGEFQFSKKEIDELMAEGWLIGEKGDRPRPTTKREVRRDEHGDYINERVYVVRVSKLDRNLTKPV